MIEDHPSFGSPINVKICSVVVWMVHRVERDCVLHSSWFFSPPDARVHDVVYTDNGMVLLLAIQFEEQNTWVWLD